MWRLFSVPMKTWKRVADARRQEKPCCSKRRLLTLQRGANHVLAGSRRRLRCPAWARVGAYGYLNAGPRLPVRMMSTGSQMTRLILFYGDPTVRWRWDQFFAVFKRQVVSVCVLAAADRFPHLWLSSFITDISWPFPLLRKSDASNFMGGVRSLYSPGHLVLETPSVPENLILHGGSYINRPERFVCSIVL